MKTTRGDAKAFGRWSRRMSKGEVPEWVGLVATKAFIQVGDEVVKGTPVGDADYWQSAPPAGYTGGRARGSWQPTKGRPASGDPNRIDAEGRAPLSEGRGVRLRAGEIAFWTSNVPYILRLAHGWSRQAPDAWVPRAVKRVANQFKR